MAANRKTAFLPVGAEQYIRDKAIETAGLVLIAVAITLFAALVSYSPSDPSLNTASGQTVNNLMGHAGAYISDIALQSLGLAGGLLVPVAAGWGWRLWKDHALSLVAYRHAAIRSDNNRHRARRDYRAGIMAADRKSGRLCGNLANR